VKKLPKIEINYDTCINCMICVAICPMGVFKDEEKKVSIVSEGECIICRGCEAACPTDANKVSD
jgi:NAD-dependent dihydropyrimidine dehydrogenase PreA subunit